MLRREQDLPILWELIYCFVAAIVLLIGCSAIAYYQHGDNCNVRNEVHYNANL